MYARALMHASCAGARNLMMVMFLKSLKIVTEHEPDAFLIHTFSFLDYATKINGLLFN